MSFLPSPLRLPRLFFAATLGLMALTARAEPDPAFHLYLLVGQSNMAGRGPVDAESQQSDPRVLMFTKSRAWQPAIDPMHFDKPAAGVGPGVAFGKEMAARDPQVRIGLVPCAVGGSSIKAWVPGAEDKATRTHPYDDMLARVLEAKKAGVFKGILWHQGESDRSAGAIYKIWLCELVARLRTELHGELPFVAGEISSFEPANAEATAGFNAQLHALESTEKKFGCVSVEGLADKGDKLHYDAASARTLGRRYAQKMIELQK